MATWEGGGIGSHNTCILTPHGEKVMWGPGGYTRERPGEEGLGGYARPREDLEGPGG